MKKRGRAIINLVGRKFGRWVVLEMAKERDRSGKVRWKCKCDCGTSRIITGNELTKTKGTRSCGCSNRANLIGKVFGRLTVLEKSKKTGKSGGFKWHCKCVCGRN